jgi:hypothetical protein
MPPRTISVTFSLAILMTHPPSVSAQIAEPRHVCVEGIQECRVESRPFIDVQAQRLRRLIDRHQQVWWRLRNEGLANIEGLSSSPGSESEASFVSKVDRLHAAASVYLESLRNDVDEIPKLLNRYERSLAFETSSRRNAEEVLKTAPTRLARAEANRDRLQKEVALEESRLRQLDKAAGRVMTHEAKTATALLHWLGPFLEAKDRAALDKAIANRWLPPVERYQKIAVAAPAAPIAPAAAAAQPVPTIVPPPPTPGPLETKLSAVEKITSQIADLRPRVEQGTAQVTAARQAFLAERAAASNAIERAAVAKSQFERVENTVSELEYRVRDAIENQVHAGKNLATYAAYSYLWSDLKERTVVPAVRDYVASSSLARKIPLSDDAMKDLFDKIRDGSTAELLGLSNSGRNLEKLIQTERLVLDTFSDTRHYIDRAVTVLAHGTPAEMQDLANEIFTFLDGRSMEIAEEATEELPEAVKAVARKALRF